MRSLPGPYCLNAKTLDWRHYFRWDTDHADCNNTLQDDVTIVTKIPTGISQRHNEQRLQHSLAYKLGDNYCIQLICPRPVAAGSHSKTFDPKWNNKKEKKSVPRRRTKENWKCWWIDACLSWWAVSWGSTFGGRWMHNPLWPIADFVSWLRNAGKFS